MPACGADNPEGPDVTELEPLALRAAGLLTARGHTIAIAESSTGGLISAALLAMPGASAFFLGGAVVYTRKARQVLLDLPEAALTGMRPATEAYALLLARTARERFGADWALAETGATGPTGNRYGDPAGHCCLAVAGEQERSTILATGDVDRRRNMQAFSAAALGLLIEALT
jgi:nicotinamide-nucleotide amidase